MNVYDDWLDDLNAELRKRGIGPVEELDAIGVVNDVAALLAHWFDIDRCGHLEAAGRIEAALSHPLPFAA